ncbi:MAG: family 16 glycoside hydrolase [Verrucomicrobiales bacterium]
MSHPTDSKLHPDIGILVQWRGSALQQSPFTIRQSSILPILLAFTFLCASAPLREATASPGESPLLLEDSFEREESSPEKEEIGNGWSTNSKSRAKGEKQVDLDGGAIHITRAAVADHGVSVVHDLDFRDASIKLRFKLGPKDDLGINIADMEEKFVHAGHICLARIRLKQVEITDLKTGRMNLNIYDRRKAKTTTPEDEKIVEGKSKYFDVDLAPDTWHQLEVRIEGDRMEVRIDDKKIGAFNSPGIAHPTKHRLRLAVNKSAWVDDVEIRGH